MRIALLVPPIQLDREAKTKGSTYPPLSLAYLGAVLRNNGHDVRIHDLFYKQNEDFDPTPYDACGISCGTVTRTEAYRLANYVKEKNPHTQVIMGGPHPTFYPKHVFEKTKTDAVIVGEGEDAVIEALTAPTGSIIQKPYIEPIDRIPHPARDLFEHEYEDYGDKKYRRLGKTTTILTSRGCPNNCSFCSVSVQWTRKWRGHSPAYVLEELKSLYDDGYRHIYIADDNFSVDQQRVIDICQGIVEEGLDIHWFCETRPDMQSQEMLDWMAKAGCYKIFYGFESGHPQILKNINKGFGPDVIRRAVAECKQAGITPHGLLIAGNPGETWETINETVQLFKELGVVTGSGIMRAFPKTWIADDLGVSDDFWLGDDPIPFYTKDYTYKELRTFNSKLFTELTLKCNKAYALRRLLRGLWREPASTLKTLYTIMTK